MSWPSTKADVLLGLTDILEEINPDLIKMFGNRNLLDFEPATLKDFNIGGTSTGHGELHELCELLELMDRIEQQFGIRFTPDELPDFFQSREITLGQMVSCITEKISVMQPATRPA